ncbi:selenium metabolism membrane protein YedE/FdhT [Siminovitchia fortis]|uniref:YeeE/YedE family protein n=1 Tax=Siminovitchia fortis TaxID=254758 RepID=A0A443IKM1_9BACI|nr:selenium metabolism membrane protein YedE/FdhT [Siminovitchia fortis]RWR05426.1 YeeE/YedE family protein [Siminovitchia fortis]WHY80748.1 selenium metabolism membrane protein YedE/FdhT [Siminovitchia fortis]
MRQLFHKVFNENWNPYAAVGMAGLLSALYFGITGTVWAVTGEFTRLGGHLLKSVNVDISSWAYFDLVGMKGTPLERTDGWIVIGMLIGALMTTLLGNKFKIRVPQQKRRLIQGFIGGAIAGFGARLALGCNLAAFFTGVPQFSFHSWIFMIATGIGTYIGVKIIRTRWWRGKPNLKAFKSAKQIEGKQANHFVQRYIGVFVFLCFSVIVLYYFINGKTMLAIAALFGAGFGILIERAQICFTSAFRDLWISGRAVMTKALAIGMIISVVITYFYIQTGATAVVKVAGPGTLVGGLLFGIGIVMAGGCETGWMYRAMEGQVHFWSVGAGSIAGATFLAFAWDHLGVYSLLVEGWKPINLMEVFDPKLALFFTLLLLFAWYLFSAWWEKHYRFGKGLDLNRKEGHYSVQPSAAKK